MHECMYGLEWLNLTFGPGCDTIDMSGKVLKWITNAVTRTCIANYRLVHFNSFDICDINNLSRTSKHYVLHYE